MSLLVLGVFIVCLNALFGLMCLAQVVYEKHKTRAFYIALAAGMMIAMAHIVFVLAALGRMNGGRE